MLKDFCCCVFLILLWNVFFGTIKTLFTYLIYVVKYFVNTVVVVMVKTSKVMEIFPWFYILQITFKGILKFSNIFLVNTVKGLGSNCQTRTKIIKSIIKINLTKPKRVSEWAFLVKMWFLFEVCFHFHNVKGLVSVFFPFSKKYNCKKNLYIHYK